MPTTGRLAGAVFFGLLAAVLAYLLVPTFPESQPPKLWYLICIVCGVLTGWMFVGPRSGQGLGPAIGTGLTGTAILALAVLVLLSGATMLKASMRGSFSGPMDAVIAVFGYMVEQGTVFYTPVVLAVWLGGGVLAGLLTDALGKRYR